jgi:hypothetical protein
MSSGVTENSVFIFVGGSRILNGLYQSANINFLKKVISSGVIRCKNFYMLGYASDSFYQDNKSDIDNINNEIIQYAASYGISLQYKRIPGRDLKSINHISDYLKNELNGFKKVIIWHHNLFGAIIGSKLKHFFPDLYLHADLKGVAPEEELQYSDEIFPKRIFKYLALKYVEKKILPRANSISVVSNRFADRVNKITSYSLDNIYIIPSVFYEDQFYFDELLREVYRKKLGIRNGELLILYSGGMQKYQTTENIFKFFKKIEKENGIRTLILSVHPEESRRLYEKYGLENTMLISASGPEVNGYYNAADIGVSFRSEDVVSIVSCPTKIPEYLATKNSVLLHEYIGDFGLSLKDKNYAIVKKNNQDILSIDTRELKLLQKPTEEEISHFSGKYSINNSLESNKALFDKLNDYLMS